MDLSVRNVTMAPWHPGRCAELSIGDLVVGYAGELHPDVCAATNLPVRTCAMELNASALPLSPSFPAPCLSPYPPLLQDVALVVDENLPAETVRSAIVEGAGDLLENVELYDVYRSEAIGAGKKSMTFALRFRAVDRTLTDEECNNARMAAVKRAQQELGATLRA